MNLMRYKDLDGRMHPILIIKEGRKWMSFLIIRGGSLKTVRKPVTEKKYMAPLQTNERKAKASLRRMARKPGTSRIIKQAIKENL